MEILARNLAALATRDPALAQLIREHDCDPAFHVCPSRLGPPVIERVTGADRQALSNRFDPLEEARRWIRANVHLAPAQLVVLLGPGMGYAALEILRALPGTAHLLLVERHLTLLRLALTHIDLTQLLTHPRVYLCAGGDLPAYVQWFRTILDAHYAETLLVAGMPSALRLDPGFYRTLSEEFYRSYRLYRMDLSTLEAVGPRMQENALQNLFVAAEESDGAVLEGAFLKAPAFVVAAGPSLARNIHSLRGVADRGLIVAVGAVIKPLLSAGIRPHLVCTLDPREENKRYFEDSGPLEDVFLVCILEALSSIVREYRGPRFFFRIDEPLQVWIGSAIGIRGQLRMSSSVGISAFLLARYLGCDPIVLVGMDFAFTRMRLHAEGVPESGGSGKIDPGGEGMTQAPSYFGTQVWTNRTYLNMLGHLEEEIGGSGTRVLDATEGGLRKRGAEQMSLREAIYLHCREERDVRSRIASRYQQGLRPGIWRHARPRVEILVDRLRAQNARAAQGLTRVAELLELLDTPGHQPEDLKTFQRRILDVRAGILGEDDLMSLLARGLSPVMLEVARRKSEMERSGVSGIELVRRDTDVIAQFFSGVEDRTRSWISILEHGLAGS